jgi:hypothetical protein
MPLHNAHEVLRKDDIIFAIDGVPIASDGSIPFRRSMAPHMKQDPVGAVSGPMFSGDASLESE